jgi:hypothetical protein
MPGDVQIRQLKYLVSLAHERHFGRAAAACHASQLAPSAALDDQFQGNSGRRPAVIA